MYFLKQVPDSINFPEVEANILEKWKTENTFQKSLKLSEGRPCYTFYDGPPFATGLPHYGHILVGTIKDIVTRWAHQKGFYVERRFGWDTHGLPIEFEIDKVLGIRGPSDVYEMGVGNYNKECRKIVMRYSKEWQTTIERMGRWIDFDNDYKTLYPTYMESVWWVFSQLFAKNLVYRGVKVMPYSTGCSTPLSNFEAGQNYKDVTDPAAFVGFALKENPNRYLVAWTTTPWTLPSNLAVCVHPDFEYVAVKDKANEKEYILIESRLSQLYKSADGYSIVEKFTGKSLKGKEYIPIFDYFLHLKTEENGAKIFTVLNGTFVTTDQGTGVVHQSPYFGEIDFHTCLENGVIGKETKMVCPVDEKGLFTAEVPDFKGIYVKDADKAIIKRLKDTGNLVKQEQITHSYPFCWRSDTPLLYKAVPSWFIRVEKLVDQLQANNNKTYWVPSFVREKRFGNWLRDARDWAVSRNRFWGTPINLWVSDDLEEVICPASIAELEKLTGAEIQDIHRESIDHLTIPSSTGRGTLRRITDVFDCWFESGSMPYAKEHYPFENAASFKHNFPADFVSEGIDQTRGWFYTLLVLSTALFDCPPYKNLICTGLVLAADGNKMSKSKQNYPDPMNIIKEYGADALRLYLINSPVVRGENLKFCQAGVREVIKDVFLPWYNAYRMFVQQVLSYEKNGKKFQMRQGPFINVMDKWILSFTNSLIGFVHKEMDVYHLYTVVSPLTKYFDTLTKWYVRLNRDRLKGKEEIEEEDQLWALSALGQSIVLITRLMGPFTPFFCDYLWDNLKTVVGCAEDSVHFTMLPTAKAKYIDEDVESRVRAMQTVIDTVRILRDRNGISLKYPLKEIVVIHRDSQFLEKVQSLETYILDETNVSKMTISQDKNRYSVQLKGIPDFSRLGQRLKGDMKKINDYFKNSAKQSELENMLSLGMLTIHGHELTTEDVKIVFTTDQSEQKSGEKWEAEVKNSCVVLLNVLEDEESMQKGLVREITNRIQKMRKTAKLSPNENASCYYNVDPKNCAGGKVSKAICEHLEDIVKATGTPLNFGLLPMDADGKLLCAHKSFVSLKDIVWKEELEMQLVVL